MSWAAAIPDPGCRRSTTSGLTPAIPGDGAREKDDREGAVAVGRASRMAEQDHFESFVARESIRFLKNHGRDPFFLVASFLKPHDPFMPAKRFADMFRPEAMNLPDTWGKVDLSKVPKEIGAAIRKNAPTPELHDIDQARRRIAFYYANLAQMDDCVGRVLTALRDLDLEKDTIVLYTADHGEMLGEHGLWQKFVFYESSVGVPLVVRAPGVTQPSARSKTLVSLVQTLPTLLELCGLPAVAGLDGASFAPDLREPAKTRDTTVFAEYNLRNPRAKYMIRRGGYKYNYYVNDMAELYNLRDDPKEMRNLALESASAAKVAEMKAQLFAWHKPQEH
jgi:Arylsulfatase A and related enzymes